MCWQEIPIIQYNFEKDQLSAIGEVFVSIKQEDGIICHMLKM